MRLFMCVWRNRIFVHIAFNKKPGSMNPGFFMEFYSFL